MAVYNIDGNEISTGIMDSDEAYEFGPDDYIGTDSDVSTKKKIKAYDYFGSGAVRERWKITFVNVYLSNSIGSDTNDGKTTTTPVKTLERAFEICLRSGNEFRIWIMDNATYKLSGRSVTGICWHLMCRDNATNPIIVFDQMAFYSCHLSFNGLNDSNKMTVQCDSTDWYTDNSFIIFNNLDIQSTYKHNGGACHFNGCILHDIKVNYADSRLYNDSFGDTLGRVNAIYVQQGGTLAIENALTSIATIACDKLLDLTEVFGSIRCQASGDLSKFTTRINLDGSLVLGTTSNISSFGAIAVSNGSCVLDGKTFIKP